MDKEKRVKKVVITAGIAVAAVTVLILAVIFIKGRYETRKIVLEKIEQGEKYLSELDYEAAITCFQGVIDIEPNYEANYGIAKAYEGIGEYEKAEIFYKEAIDNEEKKAGAYISLAELYIRQDKLDEAEELLKKAKNLVDDEELEEMYAMTNPEMPKASLEEGIYKDWQMVELTSSGKEEVIYYTLDGQEPTDNSQMYTEGIILGTGETTLKAKVYSSMGYSSDILELKYTLDIENAEVKFEDSALESIVRKTLGVSYGTLYNYEVVKIKELNIVGRYYDAGNGIKFTETGFEDNYQNFYKYDENKGSVKSLKGLENMPFLETLIIANQQDLNLDGIEKAGNLKNLSLIHNDLTDITIIGKLSNLNTLCLGWNDITDISSLGNLTELESLGIWGNQITDISAVKNLLNLIYLDFSDNKVENISAISNLTKLESLWAYGNKIKTLKDIKSVNSIKTLMIKDNPLEDEKSFEEIFHRLERTDIMPEWMEEKK